MRRLRPRREEVCSTTNLPNRVTGKDSAPTFNYGKRYRGWRLPAIPLAYLEHSLCWPLPDALYAAVTSEVTRRTRHQRAERSAALTRRSS